MIYRDGLNTSLWQNMPEYLPKNEIKWQEIYDVAIVGGGISGITTGLLLQKEGKNCIILEAHTLCFGTTGGTTAHLNTIMDTPYPVMIKNFGKENALLVKQAAEQAIELIRNNINEYNIDCGFEDADAYLFSQNQKQDEELKDIYETSLSLGLDISSTDSIPVNIPFNKAVRVKGQAKFHPTKYVMAIAEAFENAGGTIEQHCRVDEVEENEPLEIHTEKGVVRARLLIYATHIPPGVNLLNLRCAPYRSYAMALELADDRYPEGLIYDMYDPYHYYRSQKVKNKNYLISGGEDHKTAHAENTEACFLKLESDIRTWFKVKKIAYRWSSQYFEPVDGLPYIGGLPGKNENIMVATGYGGNGMIYSNVAAVLLRDMITGVESKYIHLFDPSRLKPVAGFKSFVKENADVVSQLVTKWFSADKLSQVAELAQGEGRIVKFEGHTVALYKDEHGALHALNPTCTHMKCSVAWNATEKSWDCPCHGARYSYEGKVLTGPAIHDLEKIELKELIEK